VRSGLQPECTAELDHPRPAHCQDLRWLDRALRLSDLLEPWARRIRLRSLVRPGAWKPGVSVVIVGVQSPIGIVQRCLSEVVPVAAQVSEPAEILILGTDGNGAVVAEPSTVAVRVLAPQGLGFLSAIRQAIRAARFDWLYLLDPEMQIESGTLAEILRWRAPHIFAIGSGIQGGAGSGWNDAHVAGDVIVPFAASPEQAAIVRGNLYADSRAALFRRSVLRAIVARTDPYLSPNWNDVEWGIRAWRAGCEVLFCPDSRVREIHIAPPQALQSRRRDQLQLDLRNHWTRVPGPLLTRIVSQGDPKVHYGLWEFANAWAIVKARLKAHVARVSDPPWAYLRSKYYPSPWDRHDRRPLILAVVPYAAFPPTHGGAHRIHHLLASMARQFRVVLLTDEAQLYGSGAARWFTSFHAVHLIGGRNDACTGEPERIERMRNHAHAGLRDELRRLSALHRPNLVQVEYVELALLARARNGRIPWVLTLHDVLLSEGSQQSPEDRFERNALRRFDHLIACSEEDAALLRGLSASVIRNGAPDWSGGYTPSTSQSDILFLGPFRYQPNWEGIQEFLREAFPELRSRFPELRLHILGGIDARSRAMSSELFQQSGVYVCDHVDDVTPWIQACALTINPIRNNRGSCLKVIQSLAAGRVCVSTREGARGFLDRGFRSLVVVGGAAEFPAAIGELLQHADARREIEAPERARLEPYAWAHSAELQMAIYRRLIGHPRHRDE